MTSNAANMEPNDSFGAVCVTSDRNDRRNIEFATATMGQTTSKKKCRLDLSSNAVAMAMAPEAAQTALYSPPTNFNADCTNNV